MSQSIHQIKVTLIGSRPPIWRRIQVSSEIRLNRLHDVLQAAMGWTDSHLHAFHDGGTTYGMHDVGMEDVKDERGIRLDELAAEGDKFIYEYDFGDGWEHRIEIERVFDAEADVQYPRCLDGERACPPEDCGGVPGYERLLEILGDPNRPEHEEARDWVGAAFDPEALDIPAINAALARVGTDDIPPAPAYDDACLAALDCEELLELVRGAEDRAPRNLIDECARRGAEMEDLLSDLLTDERSWQRDADPGDWWLLLHAVMILGLMAGERAGLLLVEAMRRMSRADDAALQDWLAGYWPALFRNKPDTVTPALRALCVDRGLGLYMRSNAIEVVAAAGQRGGEDALDGVLDWLAAFAADERGDWDFRLSAGMTLLDFPRRRHRPLLDDLAAQQPQRGLGAYFTKKEVMDAYAEMKDRPVWTGRFEDPWAFYTPEATAARRQRWEEVALEGEEDEWEGDEMDFEFEDAQTYVREAPKVGRNDPCPCGSGKKYKKCCLQ